MIREKICYDIPIMFRSIFYMFVNYTLVYNLIYFLLINIKIISIKDTIKWFRFDKRLQPLIIN